MENIRQKLSINCTGLDLISEMAEGNPGALTVMMELLQDDPSNMLQILSLDDMNIRGSQIWVGFKNHCNQDLKKFKECIQKRDADMVATINKECPDHVAVTHGASFKRGLL